MEMTALLFCLGFWQGGKVADTQAIFLGGTGLAEVTLVSLMQAINTSEINAENPLFLIVF
jgi:hypothetical protein